MCFETNEGNPITHRVFETGNETQEHIKWLVIHMSYSVKSTYYKLS